MNHSTYCKNTLAVSPRNAKSSYLDSSARIETMQTRLQTRALDIFFNATFLPMYASSSMEEESTADHHGRHQEDHAVVCSIAAENKESFQMMYEPRGRDEEDSMSILTDVSDLTDTWFSYDNREDDDEDQIPVGEYLVVIRDATSAQQPPGEHFVSSTPRPTTRQPVVLQHHGVAMRFTTPRNNHSHRGSGTATRLQRSYQNGNSRIVRR